MNTLNFFGAGPKIGKIALPWLAVAILLSLMFKTSFTFFDNGSRVLLYIGLTLFIGGLIFYFLTLPTLLKGLKESKLVTTGAFYLCQNPLYAAILLFIFPGIALMMNSWLVLTTSVVAYVFFKRYIKSEYAELEKFFGDAYNKYAAETPEFFPFPVKKWF